jgi:hypothetical protein
MTDFQFLLIILVSFILFSGEPDLVDALIHLIMSIDL